MTHGLSKTKIYECWHHMKQRCNGTTGDNSSKNYHQRGITYDPRWEKFTLFYEDMKNGYDEDLTLDRINVNGNYCKENCRWVSQKEQANNKRTNYIVAGKTISQWCEILGLSLRDQRRIYKRESEYGVTDFDTLFNKERLVTIKAKIKSAAPCLKCGKKGGTMRRNEGWPVRKKGLCNTCYCYEYRKSKIYQSEGKQYDPRA